MEKFYNFSYLFSEAQSNIVKFKGEKVYAADDYILKGKHKISFNLIYSNPNSERALVIYTREFNGDIYNNLGQKLKKTKGKYASLDIYDRDWIKLKKIIMIVDLKEGNLRFTNGKFVKRGEKTYISTDSRWCVMKKEQISPTITRYYCNDTENETDFDDLIFDLEILD